MNAVRITHVNLVFGRFASADSAREFRRITRLRGFSEGGYQKIPLKRQLGELHQKLDC